MSCINPFTFFITYAENYILQNPGSTFGDVIQNLNQFPKTINTCCNDCDGKPFLLIFDGENFVYEYNQTVGLDLTECCTKSYYSIKNFLDFLENVFDIGDPKIETSLDYKSCCNTNEEFKNCVHELDNYLQSELFSNWINSFSIPIVTSSIGILEINTLGGNVGFCLLKEALMQKPQSVAKEFLEAMLNSVGFVIYCSSSSIIMTRIDTFTNNYPFP